MRVVSRLALAAACLAAAWPLATAAADEPQMPEGQLWVVFEEHVKPGMLEEYERTAREFATMVGEHREEMPNFTFATFMGEDLTCYYVAKVDGHGGVDQLNREYTKLGAAMGGPAFYRKMSEAYAAVDWARQSTLWEPATWSYTPAEPRLRPEEETFFAFEHFYLLTGHGEDLQGLIDDWRSLYQRKGIADGWRAFSGTTGVETPVLIVSVGARDAADYEARQKEIREALGADAEPLIARTFAITRRYEVKRATLRPDLAIPAAAPAPPPEP